MKGMDLNKLMQQAAEMQANLQKAQEELANEIVEGSAGGVVVAEGDRRRAHRRRSRSRPRRSTPTTRRRSRTSSSQP